MKNKFKWILKAITFILVIAIIVLAKSESIYHNLYVNDNKYNEKVTLSFALKVERSLEEELRGHDVQLYVTTKINNNDVIISIPTIDLIDIEVDEEGEIVNLEYEVIK